MPDRKAFDFIKLRELPPKPRETGVIEIRGPYYTPVTVNYLKSLLDDWSDYFDGVKFAGGSFRLLTVKKLKEFIKLCHDYNVYVSTGGWVERVLINGHEAVDKYLEECKAVEFDLVEISSGMAPEIMKMPLEDKIELVRQVRKLGMKPKPEVSLVAGAGAGTHVTGYGLEYRSFEEFLKEAQAYLKAGAHILMIESEGLTEDLPPEKWRLDIIKKLIDKLGYKNLMFEAADPPVFKWFLKHVGRDVNLFIDHSQVVEFNAWRLGLWGDRDLWKGKKITYKLTK